MDRWVRQPEAWEVGAKGCLSSEAAGFAGQNKRGEKIQPHILFGGGGICFQIQFLFWKIKSEFGSGGNNPNS